MNPVDPDALAAAVLSGARRHSQRSGRTYTRRQITSKQRKLLAHLAEGDGLGAEELAQPFAQEWSQLIAKRPEKDHPSLRQTFFRNLAELASRINAYLHAGYEDPETRRRILARLGGRFIALRIWDEEMMLSAEEFLDHQSLLAATSPAMRSRRHSSTVRAARKSGSSPPHEPQEHEANPEHHGVVQAEPYTNVNEETPHAGQPQAVVPLEEPTEVLPLVSVPKATQTADASPPHVEPLVARVDPVTDRWTVTLHGVEVEVDARLGMLRAGSRIIRWPADPLPRDPEAMPAEQVRLLDDLVRRSLSIY